MRLIQQLRWPPAPYGLAEIPLSCGIALLLPARRNSVKDKRRFCLYDEIN